MPTIELIAFGSFVGFGLAVGLLFGFFGMGGSFLVTPALLVFGYPAPVAVGSGLAFVFGTSGVGALSHRDYGQADVRLAGLTIVGLAIGIEIGKRGLFRLETVVGADAVVSVAYVGLLASVGWVVLRDARASGTDGRPAGVASAVRAVSLPPVVGLPGGATVSAWTVIGTGLGIGVLSGCLGVGGGFLLVPAMIYGFGVPTAVAVGTSTVQIAVAGGFGTFAFAAAGAVDLPVVTALLAGSALGARLGAGATRLVPDEDCRATFGVALLAGSVATAMEVAGTITHIEALETASAAVIVGTVLLVAGVVVRASIAGLRAERRSFEPRARTTSRGARPRRAVPGSGRSGSRAREHPSTHRPRDHPDRSTQSGWRSR